MTAIDTNVVVRFLTHDDATQFQADALHLASSQDMGTLATFDRTFARKSTNLGVCRVVDLASTTT